MELYSPIQVWLFAVLSIAFIILALLFVFRKEQSVTGKIFWTLFILLIPIIGAAIYLLKYLVEPKKISRSV